IEATLRHVDEPVDDVTALVRDRRDHHAALHPAWSNEVPSRPDAAHAEVAWHFEREIAAGGAFGSQESNSTQCPQRSRDLEYHSARDDDARFQGDDEVVDIAVSGDERRAAPHTELVSPDDVIVAELSKQFDVVPARRQLIQ